MRSKPDRATANGLSLIERPPTVDGWWLSAPASQTATSDIVERIGTGEPVRTDRGARRWGHSSARPMSPRSALPTPDT
jgi:hypothetical protein